MVVCRVFIVACWLVCVSCCSLVVARRVLFVVCCLFVCVVRCVASYVLFVGCRFMFVVGCSLLLHGVRCELCVALD